MWVLSRAINHLQKDSIKGIKLNIVFILCLTRKVVEEANSYQKHAIATVVLMHAHKHVSIISRAREGLTQDSSITV